MSVSTQFQKTVTPSSIFTENKPPKTDYNGLQKDG